MPLTILANCKLGRIQAINQDKKKCHLQHIGLGFGLEGRLQNICEEADLFKLVKVSALQYRTVCFGYISLEDSEKQAESRLLT